MRTSRQFGLWHADLRVSLLILSMIAASNGRVSAFDHIVGGANRSVWKYLDDGTIAADGWRSPDFDDSKWRAGVAPLGYGGGSFRTLVEFGDPQSKHITTYFRHRFTLPHAAATSAMLMLCVDDGAVVYLNGEELLRHNMVVGAVTNRTLASRTVAGSDELQYHRFAVTAAKLRQGRNILAVEVHQAYPESSDIRFDMAIRIYSQDNTPRPVILSATAQNVSAMYLQQHYVPPGISLPDGFADGGRSTTFGVRKQLNSHREIIVVDRTRDPELRLHLAFAGAHEVKKMPPLPRAQRIARYVDKLMTPSDGRRFSLPGSMLLDGEYESLGLLIGDATLVFDGSVCRHRSLLFKLMADEAGLDVALVRGNLNIGSGQLMPHAWNELHLNDRGKLIVDVMNPQPRYPFRNCDGDQARAYTATDGKALYPAAK